MDGCHVRDMREIVSLQCTVGYKGQVRGTKEIVCLQCTVGYKGQVCGHERNCVPAKCGARLKLCVWNAQWAKCGAGKKLCACNALLGASVNELYAYSTGVGAVCRGRWLVCLHCELVCLHFLSYLSRLREKGACKGV